MSLRGFGRNRGNLECVNNGCRLPHFVRNDRKKYTILVFILFAHLNFYLNNSQYLTPFIKMTIYNFSAGPACLPDPVLSAAGEAAKDT